MQQHRSCAQLHASLNRKSNGFAQSALRDVTYHPWSRCEMLLDPLAPEPSPLTQLSVVEESRDGGVVGLNVVRLMKALYNPRSYATGPCTNL